MSEGAADRIRIVVEKDVPQRVRDSTILRSDVYRPARSGRYPVLLGRTQYGKETWGRWIEPERTAALGYVVVINDMRGQHASAGEFDPFVWDVVDGHDVVEWCARMRWSNGRVGMFGSSSCGFAQLQAAVARPPHLAAIAPMQTWSSFGRGSVYDPGGAFSMYTQEWALLQVTTDPVRRIDPTRPDRAELVQSTSRARWEIGRWHAHLPLGQFPALPRDVAPWYYRWLEHPDADGWWTDRDVAPQLGRIEVPALHLVGWFDRFCRTTVANYLGIAASGGRDGAPPFQRLVIGPWPHGVPVITASGDHHFGPAGDHDVRGDVVRWSDHWLRGLDTGLLEEPPVRLFVLGADRWRDEWEWPPSRARPTRYYLRSGGHANSRRGDGRLTISSPATDEAADAFVYDPPDPTPSVPGRMTRPWGTADQGPIEDRDDVLCFSTEPLPDDLDVIGPVTARLWAATDARDTDWFIKLVDVHPDGYVYRLCEGMIRARYRESQARQRLLEPGRVHEFEIDLGPIAIRFRAGHRIGVEVASASFPQFDRNMNTGGRFGSETVGVPAIQRVFHDAGRPSHLVLPIVPP